MINDPVPDPRSGGRPESPYRPEDVRLAPGAVSGLELLRDAGYVLVAVSNQPAAAKGTTTPDGLRAVHDRVVELLARERLALEAWRYCFHHPDAVVPELAGRCACRKPAPGLLVDAAADLDLDLARSWMIGDSDSDVEAGQRAGTRTVLVEHEGSPHRRSAAAVPDAWAPDLLRTAETIVALTR